MSEHVKLAELEGTHDLIYVERGYMEVEGYRHMDKAEYIRFVLDGVSYTAVEDPGDGYRSSLRYLVKDDEIPMEALLKGFPPQRVVAKMLAPEDPLSSNEDRWEYRWRGDRHEVLIIYDAVTEKPVIEVGTRSIDDYYPTFQCRYNPENMAINQGVNEE